ncbi:MAG: hypothetical protein ACUVUE_03030 [Candidatus Bathycorpusculaceae bacterium]
MRPVEVSSLFDECYEVPYVPTSVETVKRMLQIAEVGSDDVVYDLGCGDGRMLVMAVEEFGARGGRIRGEGGAIQSSLVKD